MEWNKTTEKLPNTDTEVIVSNGNYVTVGELSTYNVWRVLGGLGCVDSTMYLPLDKITHWMELPNLP